MIWPILGGILIGLSVSVMLFFNGRVTGVSGITSSLLVKSQESKDWKVAFILGLLVAGGILYAFFPQHFLQTSIATKIDYIMAGLFVGFGTVMGNGCTSGHGVCGLSRFSIRSLMAVLTFMIFGIAGTYLFKLTHGGL